MTDRAATPPTGTAPTEVGLTETVTRPSLHRQPLAWAASVPAQAFAVSRRAKRFRRPTDVTLFIVTSALLLWNAARADGTPTGLHAALVTFIDSLPGLLDPVWRVAKDWMGVWALGLIILALVRRHLSLVRDQLLSIVLVYLAVAAVGRIATGVWPDLWNGLTQSDRPIDFPPLSIALAVAVISTTSPHLSRPLRYWGRWFVAFGATAAAMVGIANPGHAFGGVVLGWWVAAVVHLALGSPGGFPSMDRLRLGLNAIGIDAEPEEVTNRGGVVWVRATRPDGTPLDVKVYGRDAWDGQLLVTLWRFVWYRDTGPTLALSRVQQVSHEAFITLLAERHGVPVAAVVSAGKDPGGNALVAVEHVGTGLTDGAAVTDGHLRAAWTALDALHDAGIAHGRLDLHTVRIDGDAVRLADFTGAEVTHDLDRRLGDEAQLLLTLAVAVGSERAVASALDAVGTERAVAMSSYVQAAALTPSLRRAVDVADIDVDAVRAALTEASGEPAPDLVKLRRVSLGGLFITTLFVVAMWMLISSLIDIGFDTIWEAIRGASWPILFLAFLVGLTPRVASAMALSAASPSTIPLARFTALQFAITFVNLAMPSTAARAAVVIRFFQRSGVPASAAVAIGVLDNVAGFLSQVSLLVAIFVFGIGDLDLGLTENLSASGLSTLLLWIGIAIVVGLVVVAAVAKLRNAVIAWLRRTWELIGPILRSPRRLLRMYGFNMTSELLFSLCMYTVLRAFGQDVGYLDVVAVNVLVAMFAGLMPVPGGVGVTEAALTAGFIAIGVDEATAFAAALSYRMVTFYIQPLIGFGALQWLKKQRYL